MDELYNVTGSMPLVGARVTYCDSVGDGWFRLFYKAEQTIVIPKGKYIVGPLEFPRH